MTSEQRRRLAAAATVVSSSLLLGGASPEARQVFAPVWRARAVPSGPCLLSAAMVPQETERCAAWTRREASGAAIHAALGLVIVGGSDRRLRAFRTLDGSRVWSVEAPGAVTSTPVVTQDAVFVGTDDGHVIRADATSGRTRWDVTVDAEVSEPLVVDDDLVLAITGADTVYALRSDTGAPAWSHKHPLPRGITLRGQARPLVVEVATPEGPKKRVFVGHASGRLSVIDRTTGAVIEELDLSVDDTFGDLDADPFAQDGRVVAASQTRGVVAIDARGLTEVWRNPETGIVRLARGGRHLVVAAGPGKVLGLDARTGDTRWRFTYARGAPTRILVQGGRVHVGSDRGSFYVLDLFSGRPLQYIGGGQGFAADPVLWNDMLVVTTTGGELLAASSAFRGLVQAHQDR